MAKTTNPTLRQIAELSGFSIAAVSMILNKKKGVSFSEETIRLVFAASEQLGYVKPEGIGRKKRFTDENLIAVFCPNISNPYYSTVVQAIEQSAREKDFRILTVSTYRSPEIETNYMTLFHDAGVAGIIFAMPPMSPQSIEKMNRSIPVVMIGDKGSSFNIDTVEMDNYGAGVLIAKHLLELGHERITYISTTLDEANSMRTRRLRGIEDTFGEARPGGTVSVRSRSVAPTEELRDLFIEHHVGYELAREALADFSTFETTAFVAVNDMVAYGVIDAIASTGCSIPGDFSVCGFDNVFPSRLSPISLTSVDNYIVDKGHNAFNMLFSRMKGSKPDSLAPNVITRVEYPPHLIVRDSSGPAAGAGKGKGE